MLMFAKQALDFLDAKQKRQWASLHPQALYGQTLGIVGMGAIGGAIAKLARAFEIRVLVYDPYVPVSIAERRQVELVNLPELLSRSDFVSINAHLTNETMHMIGEKEFRLMKRSAFLINTARAAITDEQALIKALKEGWIAGAGLDVFETEPLPPDSELWQIPNAILTPHASGLDRRLVNALVVKLFCKSLARYLAGEPLLNVLDKDAKRISRDDPFA